MLTGRRMGTDLRLLLWFLTLTQVAQLSLLVAYRHTLNSNNVLINHLSDLCELRASMASPKVGICSCLLHHKVNYQSWKSQC